MMQPLHTLKHWMEDGEKFNPYDYKIFTMLAAHYYKNESYQLFKETLSQYAQYLDDSALAHHGIDEPRLLCSS